MTATTVIQFLATLRHRGVSLRLDDQDNLKIKGLKGDVSPELREEIVQRKPEIVAALKNARDIASNESLDEAASAGLPIDAAPLAAADQVIRPVPRDQPLPLSFAQERLWFLNRLEPDDPTYNIPSATPLAPHFDARTLERALAALAERHEALRVTFAEGEDGPVQVVHDKLPVIIRAVDLNGLPKELAAREHARLSHAEKVRPFDLTRGPLLRAVMFLFGEKRELLSTIHHIVSDGWSIDIFRREMTAFYIGALFEEPVSLPPLPVQYADFAHWQRRWLSGDNLARHLAFWRDLLGDDPPTSEMPTDRPRPRIQTHRGDLCSFQLTPELSRKVHALSRAEGASPFMTLMAAFDVLLYRYSGQTDIIVGTPIANRNRSEIEPLIGFFVNTLALRVDLAGNPPFRAFLNQVRQRTLGAFEHQDLPFEKIVEELQPRRDLSRNPIAQIFFGLQNAPGLDEDLALDMSSSGAAGGMGSAHFDLSLIMAATPKFFYGSFEYNLDLFDTETIEALQKHWLRLLEGIVANPECPVDDYELLDVLERRRTLFKWNLTAKPFKRDKQAHQRIAERATAKPNAPAVVQGDWRLTYGELDNCANRIAHWLIANGAGPEKTVAICAPRSIEWMVACYAALKAGAAYLPLDPAHPDQRLRFMMEDSGAVALLAAPEQLPRFADWEGARQEIAPEWPAFADQSDRPVDRVGTLAYVIYTSGSTGQPKGVAIEHGSLANLVEYKIENNGIQEDSRVSTTSAPGFDAAVLETWPALCAGAVLYVVDDTTRMSASALLAFLARHVMTHCFLTTPMAEAVFAEPIPEGLALQVMGAGGDKLSRRPPERFPGIFFNNYGPTENTVVATIAQVEPGDDPTPPPIGRPIANVQVYIVDKRFNPVPIGVPGELCLGGDSLARGYLNRPAITAERFTPNPFSREPGRRLYRTGDRVRYRRDGQIRFMGRMDFQVKVRGFRIELGEIEAVLSSDPDVRAALALAREDVPGRKSLIAYVQTPIANDEERRDAWLEQLRAKLGAALPEYMVPSAIIPLAAFPLTPNGKVDRKALPAPDPASVRVEYVAPRNETEAALAAIWSEALGLEDIGVHDNFFQLGGHSLLATRVVSMIRQRMERELPVRAVFEAPTLAGLAEMLAGDTETGPALPPIAPVPRDQRLPLSYAQQRLFFIAKLEPNNPGYNMPTSFFIDGPFDPAAFERAVRFMIQRHEALRTTFDLVDGEPIQVVHDAMPFALRLVDLTGVPESGRAHAAKELAEAQAFQPFDLGAGPLIRCLIARIGPQRRAFVMGMHHIISDGWSMDLFVAEVTHAYLCYMHGLEPQLPPLTLHYADYAAWQRSLADGALGGQMAYWKDQLAGELPVLPTRFPRPDRQDMHSAACPLELDAETSAKLRAFAEARGGSLFMVFLAALDVVLRGLSGKDDVVVGSPIANRNRAETERIIGFFVNTLALRNDLAGNPSLDELFERVRRTTLDAYANQDLPFDKLVEELRPVRDPRITPLFQAMLLHRNAMTGAKPEADDAQPVAMTPLSDELGMILFDLLVAVEETPAGVMASLNYKTSLYDEATARRMTRLMKDVLRAMALSPQQRVAEFPLFQDAEERARLLVDWRQPPIVAPVVAAPAPSKAPAPFAPGRRVARQALGSAPIGYPYGNYRCYVLDRELAAIPFGAPGELCIAGPVLARGYFGRSDLTAEKFVPDPYAPRPGGRMYRTGDLACYFANGAIDFLGRTDFQIKIRGFRVEPGEIEETLAGHERVDKTLVMLREDQPGVRQLTAYVVLKEPASDSAREFEAESGARVLRDYLKETLPDYMVPAGLVFLDAFPLTPNGKIDRKALPAPAGATVDDYTPPSDELERRLCAVWEDVLGVRPIGVHHNFFDLGGHSLLSLRLMDRVHKAVGVALPIAALFQSGNVHAMAAMIREKLAAQDLPLPAANPDQILIPLKTTGDRHPLFLVHAVGGHAMVYQELARRFPEERPLYAFQAEGHGEEPPSESTLEAMAARYIEAMKAVQPQGPYLIGGWSMGGVVALEIAQQLTAAGETVADLILVDSMLVAANRAIDPLEITLGFIFDLTRGAAAQMKGDIDQLKPLGEGARLEKTLTAAKQAGALPADLDASRAKSLYRVFKANMTALCNYQPKPYSGRAALFQCAERPPTDYGWEAANIPVDVIEVPGNHFSTLAPPHVQSLRDALAQRIAPHP